MTGSATDHTTARYALPRLRLRQRSAEHPMAMFAIIVTAAFASVLMTPSAHTAFASGGKRAAVAETVNVSDVQTTGKTSRLPAANGADRACEGQAWGDEDIDCLLRIAEQAGKARQIRLIADAGPDHNAPNVF